MTSENPHTTTHSQSYPLQVQEVGGVSSSAPPSAQKTVKLEDSQTPTGPLQSLRVKYRGFINRIEEAIKGYVGIKNPPGSETPDEFRRAMIVTVLYSAILAISLGTSMEALLLLSEDEDAETREKERAILRAREQKKEREIVLENIENNCNRLLTAILELRQEVGEKEWTKKDIVVAPAFLGPARTLAQVAQRFGERQAEYAGIVGGNQIDFGNWTSMDPTYQEISKPVSLYTSVELGGRPEEIPLKIRLLPHYEAPLREPSFAQKYPNATGVIEGTVAIGLVGLGTYLERLNNSETSSSE
ncbi:hypothetical protein HZA38_01190 [Candidatus Peregrinibacteria bacterium]|nr:hypothetical protein [Candidatus Peregrinibacteria bacterium]